MDLADSPPLEIDSDGFVCLVAPDRYTGFVDEDWTLTALLERFVEQMNARALFVAYPGPDVIDEPLALVAGAVSERTTRAASGLIEVGAGGLWVTDYTQLTMAAQYADERPIAGYSARLPVEPGVYVVTLQEIAADSSFVLSVAPAPIDAVGTSGRIHVVPWFET
ncbi:hypothetical protein HQQ81_10975 [Microbacteriaceae bacterium VKM Ac-2854]|nr:hypothetical protein [Microbacteriaceae bacterium VKM Ac-2854]